MDLSHLDTSLAESGVFMQFNHPVTGDPLIDPDNKEPVGVVLMGADSAAYREAENAIIAARTADAGKAEKFNRDRLLSELLDRLVACTIEFRNVTLRGKPVDKKETAHRLAYVQLPWAREQAVQFIEDRANFLPKPQDNSPPA